MLSSNDPGAIWGRLGAGLSDWRAWALLLVALAGWGLAYQHKAEYEVNIGGLQDDAYVTEFHGKEGNNERDYRWSRGYSTLHFPGIGNQPVQVTLTLVGFRPDGASPTVEVSARGKRFRIETTPDPRAHTIFLERGDPLWGDLEIGLGTPTFSPPNDPRVLGVLVDRVTVRPADFGLRPFVIPPLATLAGMLAALAALYLSIVAALGRVRVGLAAAGVLALVFGLLIVVERPSLGLLGPQLPWLALLALVITLLSWMALGRLWVGEWAVGLGALAFAFGFVLRFGGLLYPQFLTSDILLHVHNVQRVVGGEWVFPGFLPDYTPVPYPPALYVILAPFSLLAGTDDATISLLLKLFGSLLDASCCLGVAWAGARLWGGPVGGLGAMLYAVSPAPFELFSAGNYTNLFAQGALNWTLLGALVYMRSREGNGWAAPTAITLGFGLTMLGHYGMMLGTLVMLALFGLWVLSATIRKLPQHRYGWLVLAGAGGALLVSFALYYRYFVNEIWSQFSSIFNRLLGGEARSQNGQVSAQEGFFSRSARRIGTLVGWETFLTAAAGLLLPLRAPGSRALLMAWVGAGALFFAVDQALGDAVRWYYLLAAPLTLLAGRALAYLSARSRAGAVLAALVFTSALWHLLQVWVGELIFTRYH